MKIRWIAALLLLPIGALVCWLVSPRTLELSARSLRKHPPMAEPPAEIRLSINESNGGGDDANATLDSSATQASAVLPITHPIVLASRVAPPSDPRTGSDVSPLTVLENLRTVFRNYSKKHGGNPVGNNAEITAALNGGNPREIVYVNSGDGLRLNERGEIVDNWDSPFFFHQVSGTHMEIRSAGPDRKLWTSDDLVLK